MAEKKETKTEEIKDKTEELMENAEDQEPAAGPVEGSHEWWNEKVEFDVPLSETEKGPLMIMVNGHYWKMQRGAKVQIPRYVLQTYRDSVAQKMASLKKQEECENQNLTGE